MTKFVLHGGFGKKVDKSQEDDNFFIEILKDVPRNANVLLVYFAESEEIIDLRIKQDTESLAKNKGEKNLDTRVAREDTFLEDCAWADAIYFHGGRTVKLLEVLNKFKNLKEVFRDKTIAGDSAGVNALGYFFYSRTSQEIGEGLKILPFKMFVHYEDGTTNPLQDIESGLETLFIREYETVVKVY